MNLLQEQITRNTERNPETEALKTKIFTLKQFGNLPQIDSSEKLQSYVEKCLAIQRPEESPRVFVCSNQDDFNLLLSEVETWEVAKNNLLLPKIHTIKPGNEALRDTFFYDTDLGYFDPSDYFVLINPNQQIIKQIELQVSQASNQVVSFGEDSLVTTLPFTTDPFELEKIATDSKNQILVGDKIMYPYQNENGEILIKLAKITY